jgi:hypothetical protein
MDKFQCEVRVTFNGKVLQLNKTISDFVLEDIIPSRNPAFSLEQVADIQRRSERRQKFIDMISSEVAHALTEAIYNIGR